MRYLHLTAVLALICLVALPATYAWGETVSKSKSLTMEKWETIDMEVGGLVLKEVRFTTDTKGTTGRFGLSATSGPYMTFVVYNNTAHEIDYGIAVALFDKNGKLVTAGSFSHTGELDPGERHEGTIVFGEVNRCFTEAVKYQVVMETY
ncbi:MAG: hypothetical protein JW885_15630 [Deltaproteobacteria bacterium]|nr:hypothetical protein [Candidatus Zymogenaceae bacterium]